MTFRVKAFLILFACMTAFLPRVAFAAGFGDFPQPTAEYSAERVITGSGGVMKTMMYSAMGKERMESKEGGSEMIQIVRMDKKLMWMLLPSEKMYTEMKLSDTDAPSWGQGNASKGQDCDVKQAEKGQEDVDGFKSRKLEVTISCPNDNSTVMVWLTKENIPIRVEVTNSKAKMAEVQIELKNLKIGKQPPALFEIPSDYKLMQMPAVPH